MGRNWALLCVPVLMGGLAILPACGGSGAGEPASSASRADTPWWKKSVWTEKHGDATLIMVTGRTGNASLDEGMAMDNASQDAREQMALYLDATTTAFRERLRKMISASGKKADGTVAGAAEKTETDMAGGRTLAEAAVRGLEVVDSRRDEESDTFYVLGQLDVKALRDALASSAALSEEERQRIEEDSAEVKEAMESAIEDARTAKR
jgi:hypothetical protein